MIILSHVFNKHRWICCTHEYVTETSRVIDIFFLGTSLYLACHYEVRARERTAFFSCASYHDILLCAREE